MTTTSILSKQWTALWIKTKSCINGCPNAIINAGTGFKVASARH